MNVEPIVLESDQQLGAFALDFAKLLDAHKLFPDTWRKDPLLVIGAVRASKFWKLTDRRGRLFGLVWLSNIVPGDSAMIHVIMDKKYRRLLTPKRVDPLRVQRSRVNSHGRGKLDAMAKILDYAFNDLGVRRITGMIPFSRKSALRLAKKAGFSNEGRLSEASMLNGKVDDLVIWGLTRKQWIKS